MFYSLVVPRASLASRPARWLALLFGIATLADSTNALQRLALNPEVVVRIPVATDRLTTVRFPGPVQSVEAAFIATTPHPDARFLLSFQAGNEFFSLRALTNKVTATLNVAWNRQTYVLELVEATHPWLSVTFEQPVPTRSSGNSHPVTPSRLFGLLDTARAFPLLKQQHPGAVAGVECVRPNTSFDYRDYAIRLDEVLRFDAEDTLVFRVALTNHTAQPIHYLPQSLMVRAGQRVYFQSLTDANGVIPPQAETSVSFVVTGTPDGSRNDLSPRNEFMVMLSRFPSEPNSLARVATPPATSPPPLARPPDQSHSSQAKPSTFSTATANQATNTSLPSLFGPTLSASSPAPPAAGTPAHGQSAQTQPSPSRSLLDALIQRKLR